MRVRIYLTGPLCLERGDTLVAERAFPGRQGRLTFAYLTMARRPVASDEVADILWGDHLPEAWNGSVSAIVSKLRNLLGEVGLPGKEVLAGGSGLYEVRLPTDVWVDVEVAEDALDEAEGALRASDLVGAWSAAAVASAIARRPFLPGEEGPWVDARRERLRTLEVRALHTLGEVWLARGDWSLAGYAAGESLALNPFREAGYRQLMQAHASGGNRAEALLAYERCRKLLAEELGVSPSAETEALYLEVLRSS